MDDKTNNIPIFKIFIIPQLCLIVYLSFTFYTEILIK